MLVRKKSTSRVIATELLKVGDHDGKEFSPGDYLLTTEDGKDQWIVSREYFLTHYEHIAV